MSESKEYIKKKSFTGFIWRTGEGIIAQGVVFIVGVFLARLISPEEFGIVALSGIFSSIIGIFSSCGLGQALIQKKDIDDLDTNTVFISGLCLSSIVYLIIFISAPYCASIFHQPLITKIMRISSLTIFFSSYNLVQSVEISRSLIFKKYFNIGIISSSISAISGLSLAFYGFGVWALVIQGIIYSLTKTACLTYIIKWKPKWQFSYTRFKPLFKYGFNLMLAGIIGKIFNQARGMIIGIKYQASDLSFYNRGESLPNILCNNINGTMENILLPALSKLQDKPLEMKSGIRRSIMTSTYILTPMMFGLSSTADKVIPIVFSETWMPSVAFLRVISIGYCFHILSSTNLMAIKAIGRSDIALKLEFIKKPIFILLLLIGMQFGPLGIAITVAINSISAMIVNAWYNKSLIFYSIVEQWKDIYPQFLLSIIMAAIVFLIGLLNINIYLSFLLQIMIGVIIYWGLSYLFRLESYHYTSNLIHEVIHR